MYNLHQCICSYKKLHEKINNDLFGNCCLELFPCCLSGNYEKQEDLQRGSASVWFGQRFLGRRHRLHFHSPPAAEVRRCQQGLGDVKPTTL